jgi:hypothetical protein
MRDLPVREIAGADAPLRIAALADHRPLSHMQYFP